MRRAWSRAWPGGRPRAGWVLLWWPSQAPPAPQPPPWFSSWPWFSPRSRDVRTQATASLVHKRKCIIFLKAFIILLGEINDGCIKQVKKEENTSFWKKDHRIVLKMLEWEPTPQGSFLESPFEEPAFENCTHPLCAVGSFWWGTTRLLPTFGLVRECFPLVQFTSFSFHLGFLFLFQERTSLGFHWPEWIRIAFEILACFAVELVDF